MGLDYHPTYTRLSGRVGGRYASRIFNSSVKLSAASYVFSILGSLAERVTLGGETTVYYPHTN